MQVSFKYQTMCPKIDMHVNLAIYVVYLGTDENTVLQKYEY